MIDIDDVVAMIEHWLATPPNGYFGLGYGNNLAEQLLKNTNDFTAQAFLQKMRADIPLLDGIDVDIYEERLDFERMNVYVKVGEVFIEIKKPNTDSTKQDYYHVTAN